jgi:Methyl-accepting chemotaxis protein
MSFLGNLRISHKISALMIGLVIGFIAIGVTYYIQVGMDKAQRQQELKAMNFQSQLTEISLQDFKLQATASAYMNTPSSELAAEYGDLLISIRGNIAIAKDMGSGDGAQALGQADELLNYHENLFAEAVELGGVVTGELSVLNLLSKSSESIEQELTAAGANEELNSFKQFDDRVSRGVKSQALIGIVDVGVQAAAINERWSQQDGLAEAAALLTGYRQQISRQEQALQSFTDLTADMSTTASEVSALLGQISNTAKAMSEATLVQARDKSQVIQAVVTAIIFLVAISTAVGIYFIYRSIIFPMAHMQNVIARINRGKTQARVKFLANDELGDLGRAFNKLFDERIQQLEDQSHENDRLNNSIISLIRALGMIANKDLTIKVPVSEDITGTVSDAVNLLTTETAKTLQQVKDISDDVNTVSEKIDLQSRNVTQVAESERRQVIATSKALDVLAKAMNEVAKNSGKANQSAGRAIENTRAARESVVETVSGIRTIRETISETEKRMKRLGDRSQEISGIVNLINTIAERTHILALNASMHAASAGEAGKGFAVVADEVQRLAESARQSTDEISSMVNNIRVETSDTVTIMNTLISQVADGSRMAEKAGEQMSETETATQALVETVKIIAEQASKQAEVAGRVRDRSIIIRNFTEKTAKQLDEQKGYTEMLTTYAATLVDRVNVFVLPESQKAEETVIKKTKPELLSVG